MITIATSLSNTEIIRKLELTLEPELGTDLAEVVAASINKRVGASGDCAALFYEVGQLWAPLLVHWRNWVQNKMAYPPVLMMRDAKPLTALSVSQNWELGWMNRVNCGITDELSGDLPSEMDSMALSYLKQNGFNQPFTFVDGGCWGTIVLELHKKGLQFQPLFFFSHNPFIPGFLNELGVDKKIGERLNDSFECAFPNFVRRPNCFQMQAQNIIEPVLVPLDDAVVTLAQAALDGVTAGERNSNGVLKEQPIISVERLVALSEKANQKGEFTGVLPMNTPTWSGGQAFWEAWPKELSWT